MTIDELQIVVILEAVCLGLVIIIIVAGFKRWKGILFFANTLATAAFFAAWSPVMALGSTLVYTPASVLMWVELGKEGQQRSSKLKFVRFLAWSFLAIGITTLIVKNIYNIFVYLGYY